MARERARIGEAGQVGKVEPRPRHHGIDAASVHLRLHPVDVYEFFH